MAGQGQTNSWIGNIQLRTTPCIGDTVRMTSGAEGVTSFTGGDITPSGEEIPIQQTASIMWWIVAGLFVGYLLKGKRRVS